MKNSLTIKVNSYESLLYFTLIPFLFPRGFLEYFAVYKTFFTIWLYFSMALIVGMIVYKTVRTRIHYKNCIWVMVLYYLAFIMITLTTQGGISEGLQKLFVTPVLCLFCATCIKKEPLNFIRCVSNILIINFLLNISVFSPLLWQQYFDADKHIIFLGHVQVVSQLGVLGIFISYILYEFNEKKTSKWLLILSAFTMLVSETAASYIALILICIFFLISKKIITLRKKLGRPGILIFTFLVINLVIYFFLKCFTTGNINEFITIATSGRTFIWREALKLMKNHWLIGYGAYGVLIRVFWSLGTSSPNGMNYAHNEILQRLLDGGLILVFLFLIMVYTYIKNVKKSKNKKLNYWSYTILIIVLILMLFESVTEYYYFFIFLSMLAYLPEIDKAIVKRRLNYGTHIENNA